MGLLDGLNKQQLEAVQHFEGPLLILAGAGSGKTRVLTHRIAWLIEEKQVNPWNILAITFTNKAAGEMRDRVEKLVEYGGDSIWVSTFHSTCARILRRYIGCLGYETSYAIYDTDDQKSVMKDVCKRLNIDVKIYKERAFLSAISSAKDQLIGPDDYLAAAGNDPFSVKVERVYKEYQRTLKHNNAVDFDDLIYLTVKLFEQQPEILAYYQNRFQYILVDEYQDTNFAQFRLISLMAGDRKNLCVVGDDDQSIYRFRGADIRNILDFEQHYPSARVIRLEQNYRSTQHILDVANSVISNNKGRKSKTLWTEHGTGDNVHFRQFPTAEAEAQYIVNDIRKNAAAGNLEYGDCAILYRTNAQSRLMEEQLLLANIPYRIVGGINFYARKEIKDVLSYLKTVHNASDDLAVQRIINVPRRGIGTSTIAHIQDYAIISQISFFDALSKVREIPGCSRSASKVESFLELISSLRKLEKSMSVSDLLRAIAETSGYMEELETDASPESQDRIDNIEELFGKALSYEENTDQPSVEEFLQEVSLVADIDSLDSSQSRVVLMTLHSAKGLEFPQVYMSGMEEGIFPSYLSIVDENPEQAIEEERRLCYVGITRAMKELTLTSARERIVHGRHQAGIISRFVREIPDSMLETGRSSLPQRRSFRTEPAGFGERIPDKSFSFGSSASSDPGSSAHQKPKEVLRKKAFVPEQYHVSKPDALEYGIGDRVRHVKFGEGTVRSIVDGSRDFEVTVDFDGPGVKKMFAGFAKLKKI